MANLISSAFYFDSDAVREDCLTALGIDLDSILATEVVVITDTEVTIDSDLYTKKIVLVDVPEGIDCTVTVPVDSTSGFSSATDIVFVQVGDGGVNFEAGAGATLQTAGTARLRDKFSKGSLTWTSENTWLLSGDLAGIVDAEAIAADVLAQTPNVTVPTDRVATSSAATQADITSLLTLGGPASKNVNTIQILNTFGGPFELEVEDINILPLTQNSNFSISNLNPGSLANSFSFFIGVTPLPFKTDRWIKAGVKISYDSTTQLWLVESIANGVETTVDAPNANNPDIVNITYTASTSQFAVTVPSYNNTTVTSTISQYTAPIYSRCFVAGNPAGLDFDLTFSGLKTGRGNKVLTKLQQGDDIIEFEANKVS
jgi:hypothetical protein